MDVKVASASTTPSVAKPSTSHVTSISLMDQYRSLEHSLDRELGKFPIILKAEHRLGMKKTNIVFSLIGLVFLYIALQFTPSIVLALTAFVYPATMTIKAIEDGDRKNDIRWLSYWLVVAFACVLKLLIGDVFSFIPGYTLLKFAGCVYLFLPSTNGASVVYEHAIRPVALLIRDHPTVQQLCKETNKTALRVEKEARSKAKEAATNFKDASSKIASEVESKVD